MCDMRYLSLFSGIEAATVAWGDLGWECVAVAEIEPFPCAMLAHHYPTTLNLGDVTKLTWLDIAALGPIDLVVFGSPCQDLSLAGNRKGLAGARSGLFHTAMDIVRWARQYNGCRFALWENVPGAFSSNAGADFACVVGEMAGLDDLAVPKNGWGTQGCAVGDLGMLEWSVLDAQWFGVAQRRRRVFALADFGDWANRPPLLLEPESMRGDPPTRAVPGQDVAGTLAGGARGNGGYSYDDIPLTAFAENQRNEVRELEVAGALATVRRGDAKNETLLLTNWAPEIAATLTSGSANGTPAHGARSGSAKDTTLLVAYGGGNTSGPIDVFGTLTCEQSRVNKGLGALAFDARQSDVCVYGDVTGPLMTDGGTIGVMAFDARQNGVCVYGEATGPLDTNGYTIGVHHPSRVRRLTPRECERLQGFPDDYTAIPFGNEQSGPVEGGVSVQDDAGAWHHFKPAADGVRYKALGNSMAAPVMAWIGMQLQFYK